MPEREHDTDAEQHRRFREYIGGRLRRSKIRTDIVKVHTERHTITVLKGFMCLAFALLQLAIIIVLFYWASSAWQWYLLACLILSICTAVYIISSRRSAGTKAIWVLFVLIFFVIGFIVFWLSDDNVMYGRSRKRHMEIQKDTQKYLPPYVEPTASDPVVRDSRLLYEMGGFTQCDMSGAEYCASGGILFDKIIADLEKAEHFIFIEFFIFADGELFETIWDILLRKMDEGVEVYIIYDDMGTSKQLKVRTARRIRNSKAHVHVFNRLVSRFSFAMNYRDHRKIVIVDGKVAYIGGCNLADEYTNSIRMYGYWKDSGVKLTGPAVDSVALMFMRQWSFVIKEPMDYDSYLGHFEPVGGHSVIIPFGDGPDYGTHICKGIYESMISAANEFIYIFTPYFVLDETVTDILKNKALAGIDVRVVIPDIPDKSYVFVLTLDTVERMLPYGVKVYRLKDSFVHSKTVLTENCAVVGSANFDMRSFYQQFENSVYSDDPKFMRDVMEDFENCFRGSTEVKEPEKHGIFYRIYRGFLRIVAPLM